MNKRQIKQIKKIILASVLMLLGLCLFKWYPMFLYGEDILYDASAHIVFASLVLYSLYFFIDQNKDLRIPYFLLSFTILIVISFQRIQNNAHNDIGLLKGFLISIISIVLANWDYFKRKINF